MVANLIIAVGQYLSESLVCSAVLIIVLIAVIIFMMTG